MCLHPKLRPSPDMSVTTKDKFRNGRQNMLKGGICCVSAFVRAQPVIQISAGTRPPPNVSVDATSGTRVTTPEKGQLSLFTFHCLRLNSPSSMEYLHQWAAVGQIQGQFFHNCPVLLLTQLAWAPTTALKIIWAWLCPSVSVRSIYHMLDRKGQHSIVEYLKCFQN